MDNSIILWLAIIASIFGHRIRTFPFHGSPSLEGNFLEEPSDTKRDQSERAGCKLLIGRVGHFFTGKNLAKKRNYESKI
jgi:hypothetical protein